MKDGSDSDWKAAWKRLPERAPGDCPSSEDLSAFVVDALEGARKDVFLVHLAACAACRDDVVAARSPDAVPTSAALRRRLYRLLPARPSLLPGLAVAAAALLAVVGAFLLLRPRSPKPDAPTATRSPKALTVPKEAPRAPEPSPSTVPTPEPPRPTPPAPVPAPAPTPPPPAPPAPAPAVLPKPPPPPEKPGVPIPAPEKPAPEPTRVALKGSVLAVTAGCSAQSDGEAAALPLRAGQRRDFAGMLRLKADSAAGKLAVGTVTYYLQRGSELSLVLEEGQTTVRLARGEVFFDVLPGQGRFRVETAHGGVSVRGTRFLVSTEAAGMDVLLQKGAVDVDAAGATVSPTPGEGTSVPAGRAPSAPQKADLAKRLAWLRSLEDTILIHPAQMALQGGMAILADPTAAGGRAIGVKAPLKPGQEAAAEILARRRQSVPYVVWVRLHWAHGVPSALTLAVGDAPAWSSKNVAARPTWQWVRVGAVELPEERFRVRLGDTQAGLRIDQIVITSDPELNPESK